MCLLKFPGGKMDFDILNVFFKPNHNYIKIECRPHMRGYTGSVFFGGFGSKPRRNTYFSRVFHQERLVVLWKVSSVFYLQPVFEQDGARDALLSEGVQFMKIESREELEHRKRNINYLLKIYEKEPFVKLDYSARESEDVDTRALRPFPLESTESVAECVPDEEARLRRCIFNARIVNLGVLKKMFGQADIHGVLRAMTVHFRGRFLLKNEFYEQKFQVVRKAILDEIARSGHLAFGEAQKIPQRFVFLLEELCEKAECGYVLKGYDEMLGIDDEALEMSDAHTKIQRVLASAGMASLQEIVRLSGLNRREVAGVLAEAPFVKLSNGCYVACSDKPGSIRALLVDLFSKKASVRKSELMRTLREGLGHAAQMEQVVDVLDELCVQRAGSWVLKESK